MRLFTLLALVPLTLLCSAQLAANQDSASRAQAVSDAFRHAWDGYKRYAFPHDEVRPVTRGYDDSRNGWGATAVDALSTAILMGHKDIVADILEYIPTIDWTQTQDTVSLFETTIRYLGGMLSAYDLLKGPYASWNTLDSLVDGLLQQSVRLADTLKFAFDTPSGVPHNVLNFTSRTGDKAGYNGLATTGTLVLEWTRLSDLTGNPEYAQLAQRAENYLLNPLPANSSPWPGLVGTHIDINTGKFLSNVGGWNGGDDSYYEYLIKMYVYDPEKYSFYRDRWEAAADSTITHLTTRPASRTDLIYPAAFSGQDLVRSSQHLACFDGGNFLLGGRVLGRSDYIQYGLLLTAGCRNTYTSTQTGIGPEQFGWDVTTVPQDQFDFFQRNGFYINSGAYLLRPEVIESYYYAYRTTGDPKYQDWAWEAFQNINRTCRTPIGFSAVADVNQPAGGGKLDQQESFAFAEMLKYAYIVHAPDAPWQVPNAGGDQFVFNTEAHPIRVKAIGAKRP